MHTPAFPAGHSLDPADWSGLRRLAHGMLEDLFNDLEGLRDGPAWQPMPDVVRASWQSGAMPRAPRAANLVYQDYRERIAPYATGNRHPGFMGWVHGGGCVAGVLGEMLAAGLNANLGGRDHAPIACEREVVRWAAEMLGLPATSSGLLVTGTSIANFMAVLVARHRALGDQMRHAGVGDCRLTGYAAAGVHGCVGRAFDMAGLGTDALRLVACDAAGAMDLAALQGAIARDIADGFRPFMVIGTAGSVDIGAIDDLAGVAAICAAAGLWFHVDGAFGAAAMLAPALRPRFNGIERADSVAFDFHKWFQVPYDAGCLVVRDAAAHRAAFDQPARYLRRSARGLAGGDPWPCDLGPDLSRGFRALKVWMTLKIHGADRLGEVAQHCCDLAQHLAAAIDASDLLERVAPVVLNIVCFRFRGGDDALQADIAADVQETGVAVPSTTIIGGRLALRAAIVNHRTERRDIDALVAAVLEAGLQSRARAAESGASTSR